MNGVQTRFKCKLDVKRCKRFVFPPSSLLPRSNALKTKAIRYFQTDRTLTRIVSPPLQVRQLLTRLADRFSGGEVWFDVCGPMLAKSKHIKPDSLRGHNAQIRSGLKDGHEVEVWEPRLQLIEQALYQKFFPKRWGFGGMLMGKFPGICKRFSSLLGYQIK